MSLMQMLSFGDTGWGMALLKAALMTVLLTLAALVVGALVGSLVAMAKLSKKRALRYLGDAYSILFRGIPELLVIYLFYFGGASVVTAVNHWFGGEGYVDVPPFMV
ncbi:MAG: ABC transporter permease subunit, partial [Pseudomonas sp.]